MELSVISHFRIEPMLVARVDLGLVLAVSGAMKLRDTSAFTLGLLNYGIVPRQAGRLLGRIVPSLEVSLALALLVGLLVRAAASIAACMLSAFLLAVIINLVRGRFIECHCFGAGDEDKLGPATVLRLLTLLALSLFLATGAEGEIIAPPPDRQVTLLSILLALAFIQIYTLAAASPSLKRALWAIPTRGVSPGTRVRLRDLPADLLFREPYLGTSSPNARAGGGT